MAEENFKTNLLRTIAAELYFLIGMSAAREMYGKSYFSLGVGEKQAIDQAVLAAVGANYQGITPEFLREQTSKQAPGFQAPVIAKSEKP